MAFSVSSVFSVSKRRPFRSLGLCKSSGKHAAPKGYVPPPRAASEPAVPHRPAHAATMPRLTGPEAGRVPDAGKADADKADTERADAEKADAGQQSA